MDGELAPAERSAQRLPALTLAFFVTTLIAGITAAWLDPVPFSDWEYYWVAAADLSRYERGGLLLLALAPLQLIGFSPAWTALLFNLPFLAALLWCADRLDPSRDRKFALALAMGALLLAPYLTLVQLDFSATVVLGVGLAVLLDPQRRMIRQPVLRIGGGLALVAIACSTRPQFVLVLPVFAALLWFSAAGSRRVRDMGLGAAGAVLIVGSMAGFALDSGLRAYADRSAAVRYSSGVTLYAGLLASGSTQECGRWSPEATRMARADMDRPVLQAVAGRLSERPVIHWASVVWCKVPHIVMPGGFAMEWVLASPNVADRLARHHDRSAWLAWRFNWVLNRAWQGFVLVGYGMAIWMAAQGARRGPWRWVPACWLLSFGLVHLVFEIQERYFLGTFLLIPLLACLAWKRAKPEEESRRFDQG